ncbi:MAG: ThiF family adenylyltransferase [Clostridia bacterium]|nr:ThiF family adenylyltransferase [Clostridia bacterium]
MSLKNVTQLFSIEDRTVCIIGCGALGTNAAVHLAGAGVKKLYLCDFDTVSLTNLNRQFLFTKTDGGFFKCNILKERLSHYSVETEYIPTVKKIMSADDLSFAKECDILLCCVDNAVGRKAVADFSAKEKIPSVFGGVDGFYGTAYLFVPDLSPCPDCAGIINDISVRSSVSSSAGIIGAMEVNLALRYLLSKDRDAAGKIFIFDGNLWDTLPIKANPECKKCNISEVKV